MGTTLAVFLSHGSLLEKKDFLNKITTLGINNYVLRCQGQHSLSSAPTLSKPAVREKASFGVSGCSVVEAMLALTMQHKIFEHKKGVIAEAGIFSAWFEFPLGRVAE